MPRYAGGKYALGISDRSGRAYPLTSMIKEWNGLLVGRDEFEAKQPQLDPRHHITDPQALRISRPDRTEPAVTVLLPFNPFKSGSSGSAVITVTEPGHGRSTGDTVRFRKVEAFDGFTESAIEDSSGFAITKVDSDSYTFTSGSGTATTGNIKGGGGFASAGPVTVSA
jgi:hypothetical protein|tara:strand:+ start:1317 stop:1820 length:504 start_codon:yes stop_codon:yes gene_type:complete